jgi:hypothetical protein
VSEADAIAATIARLCELPDDLLRAELEDEIVPIEFGGSDCD